MKKRLLTAALSAILFTIIFSWFLLVPISRREPNVYYTSFLNSFIHMIIVVIPVFFLLGLPLSILIDKVAEKFNKNSKWAHYFVRLGLYSLTGLLFGVIIMSIFNKSTFLDDVIPLPIGCFIASNIYYHLLLLVSKVNRVFN